jgi:hypothetical protein
MRVHGNSRHHDVDDMCQDQCDVLTCSSQRRLNARCDVRIVTPSIPACGVYYAWNSLPAELHFYRCFEPASDKLLPWRAMDP